METSKVVLSTKVDDMVIGFKITSIDLVNKVCNLRVTAGTEGNLKNKMFSYVPVSNLLSYSISNDKDYVKVGVYYESKQNSSDFKKNPLSLIYYTDKEGILRYLLTLVNERPSLKREVLDPLGNVYIEWVNRYHSKNYYKRYRNYVK